MATPTQNSTDVTFLTMPASRNVAAITDDGKWGAGPGAGVDLTYSIPASGSRFAANYSDDNEPGRNDPNIDWHSLDAVHRAAFEQALDTWADVADIRFVGVADNAGTVGEIRIALSDVVRPEEADAWAYLPDNSATAGDIWLSPQVFDGSMSIAAGSFNFETLIHELGHALGLKHPFDDGFSWDTKLPAHLDNMFRTVMSYTEDPTGHNYVADRYPSTPMVLDIEAIQYLYGPNTAFNAGDDTYIYTDSGAYLETIWDAGGIDEIVYTGSEGARIDLREGRASTLGQPVNLMSRFTGQVREQVADTVWIARGARIENATGGDGDDLIIGNNTGNVLAGQDGPDRLLGNGGRDVLDGGAGDDVLDGGPGRDTLRGATGDDTLAGGRGEDTLDGGDGLDTARYTDAAAAVVVDLLLGTGSGDISVRSDVLIDIENVFGSAYDDTLSGDGGDNRLAGRAGADVLSGGAGDDVVKGNKGNDVLRGGPGDDLLKGGAGIDTADFSSLTGAVTVDLAARSATSIDGGTDVLRSIERVVGGAGNDTLSGNQQGNRLDGGDGDDQLSGLDGADRLRGGAGDDTLIGGAGDDVLRGNKGNDHLIGNEGADRLLGAGGDDVFDFDGIGADRINGGAGTDTLRLTGAGQVLNLRSSPAGQFQDIEIIDLTGSGDNKLVLRADNVAGVANGLDAFLADGMVQLLIDGDAGDKVVSKNQGWLPGADIQIGDQFYATYTHPDLPVELLIDTDIQFKSA